MKHFAVETKQRTPTAVTGEVVRAASKAGYTFDKIEFMDRIKVGTVEFQRFRCGPDPTAFLETMFADGWGIIVQTPEGFEVRLRSGRKGFLPMTTMLAIARTPKLYRGPGDPYWERQFES